MSEKVRRLWAAGFLILVAIVLPATVFACSSQGAGDAKYSDPSKKYAAFLVMSSPNSALALASAQNQTERDLLVTGPIDYYDPATKNFDAYAKKMAAMKQVTCIFLVGSLFDLPVLRKSAQQAGFKGEIRFLPISGPANPTSLTP